MWTYKRPHQPEELTKSYIEERGKLALCRALSIGRVIGFVGSGATIGYGQASWSQLAEEAFDVVHDMDKEKRRKDGAGTTALDRLKLLKNTKKHTEDITHTLGLAERFAKEIGEEEQFREKMGAFFSRNRTAWAKGKPDKLQDVEQPVVDRRSQPLRRIITDLRVSRLLTLNYDSEIEEEFYRLFRTSGAEGLPRPATKELSEFERLCAGNFEQAKGLPARVEHTDGTTRSVLSVSMNASNIGQLVNFALQPMQYVGQVFHLHGRFDRPKDMVLTDLDYRATYLKSDEQAQTFDEALSALMSGNDILFVGVGMSELDLLRPLRQFVSRDRSPEFSKRHVFAMRENSVSLDIGWLQENGTDREADVKNFRDHHLKLYEEKGGSTEGSAYADHAADESMAVNHRTEYGVYSIFHGNQSLRSILMAEKLLKAAECEDGKTSPLEGRIKIDRYIAALEAMRNEIQHEKTIAPNAFELDIPSQLLTRSEFQTIARALNDTLRRATFVKEGRPAGKNGLASVPPSKAVAKKISALASEARSRALDFTLQKYALDKDKWWAEWRKAPKSRNALFRQTYMEADEESLVYPTAARHRPIYRELPKGRKDFEVVEALRRHAHEASKQVEETDFARPFEHIKGRHLAPFDTNQIAYFDEVNPKTNARSGEQRDFAKVPPKRVLRASMQRGHGKGSLLHVLQQPAPKARSDSIDRLIVDTLFDKSSTSSLANGRYFGSFFLHLSFSMEFASVISALKMFVEQATCGVIVEYAGTFADDAKRRLRPDDPGMPETFLGFLQRKMSSASFERKVRNFTNLKKNGLAKREQVGELVREFSEEFWVEQTLRKGTGRTHRLEELRSRLSAFTDVVDILGNRNIRLAIVMSGLDKLCDSKGSAYNPMFRALFRLLSSCGAKTPSEADITTPLDLVLINGQKDIPIRYLSEEFTKAELRGRLKRLGAKAPKDVYSSYTEYQPIGDNRFLKKWPVLPLLKIEERYWLDHPYEARLNNLLFKTLRKASDAEPPLQQDEIFLRDDLLANLKRREVSRLCHRSVALHSWLCGAFRVSQARSERMMSQWSHDQKKSAFDEQGVAFINHMDAAAGRGGTSQIVREILEVHKEELRLWGGALQDHLSRVTTVRDFRNWPPIDLRQTSEISAKDATTNEANYVVDLVYLVLSHLALFPMPVETRVLYGCDEIYRLLAKICDADEHSSIFNSRTPNSTDDAKVTRAKPHNWRDIKRLVRMRFLSQVMSYLSETGLVIAVRGKSSKPILQTNTPLNVGDKKRSEEDIHTRYTVQHQLRDFVARLMDLSLPDQGERNFFQVSIYCDQPRDLPAPRADHYALVRQIMDRQIEHCRNSIWTMMQLGTDENWKTLKDTDYKLLKHGLKRRVLKLSDQSRSNGKPVTDPQLPSLHAVPQRIRALYGLLRSGFSIGTVSRLSALDEREIDQPYERFKGWLRGVTNAAIGWDYVLDKRFNMEPPRDRELDPQKARAAFEKFEEVLTTMGGCQRWPDGVQPFQEFGGFARPLYRDEIGWLLNERGLVSLVQGQIFDAIPLFQRALDEMHHEDVGGNYDPALHAAVRRVHLNLAIALIDRGHLGRASTMLRELQLPEDFSSHSGSQISWLSRGYVGLIDHLSGNLDVALKTYDETIARAQDREMVRVVGIFSKHKADLLRRKKDFDGAHAAISAATNAALNCAQRDILHLAKVSEGHLNLVDPQGSNNDAATCMIEALHFSQTMGIPRLESEARSLQAAMMLAQGERMIAGSAAAEAAAIANRNGLRLNKLLALRRYGASLRSRGQLSLAEQVLTETRREAERREYQGLARSLANELRQIM